jgi:methylamine utilization protein MauE
VPRRVAGRFGIIPRLALPVRIAVAAMLALASAAKLRSPRLAGEGVGTFGVPSAARVPAAVALALVEAALAVGVATGSDAAAYGAAALVAGFAIALAAALARGRGGAPCGCFGARSRITRAAVARNAAVAAVAAAIPSLPRHAPSGQGWLVVGLVFALVWIAALAVAVLALAREVGLLRLRLGPESALELADEGPPLGARIGLSERFAPTDETALALAVFSSDGCRLCQSLKPVIAAFARDPLVAVEVFDEARDADVWHELAIPGSPFALALDRNGAVQAKGTFNSYGQLESILATAERRVAEARA